MNTKIKKWGNSLAVRIPKPFAEEAGLDSDSRVEIFLRDGELIISPKVVAGDELDDLLEAINEDNIHGEVDWSEAVGREEW